jgi:hypothetical protein
VIENGGVLARSDFADTADTFALFKLVVPWRYRHAQRMPKEDFGQAGERESLRRCGTFISGSLSAIRYLQDYDTHFSPHSTPGPGGVVVRMENIAVFVIFADIIQIFFYHSDLLPSSLSQVPRSIAYD